MSAPDRLPRPGDRRGRAGARSGRGWLPGDSSIDDGAGVNLHTAATFMARVGEIGRFKDARKLVSYLGLDPRVRQSGEEPVRYGHISKEGASEARHMLCEAAWIVVRYPSPLSAFSERIKARRGSRIATVAVARKLVVLFWHLLTKEEDYAFGRPTLTQRKPRRLELLAGAEPPALGRAPQEGRPLEQGAGSGRGRARPPGGGRLPAACDRLAAGSEEGRERDTGTRSFKAV
ncbi:MAG: transposase [Thermoleophilaceae bacterium]